MSDTIDEFALPVRFTADERARLRARAIAFMRDDDWEDDLNIATAFWRGDLTSEQVIEQVENAADKPGATPFRYFVTAARIGGLESGRNAYREATTRRLMLEIATSPIWAQARSNLGLN